MIIIILSAESQGQTVYVPLQHWTYDFIERCETKQTIKLVLNNSKPLTRNEVADYLVQIYQNTAHGTRLNKAEQQQFNFLTVEFREELHERFEKDASYKTRIERLRHHPYIDKIVPRFLYSNNRHLFSWQQEQFQIFFDPVFYYHLSYVESDTSHRTGKMNKFTNGIQFRGTMGGHVGFSVDARDNKEWGMQKYKIGNYTLPRLGFVRATSPDFIYHDETEAYLHVTFNHFSFVYGKFKNYWGPGKTGSLMLSDYATSYDQFKWEVAYKRFKFTSIYAFLIDYQDYGDDQLQQRKYFAGHRLEVAPWRWLSLGFSETVIFTGRSFEPSYINPIMFYRSAEHYLGSPDNMMLGMDAECFPYRNIKLYGELLIDDITTSKLGTDWFGNKLGLLAGIFFVEPITIDNLDLRLEYVRLRPYVYSHHRMGQNYKHYDSTLGYWIGPNSDMLFLEMIYRFSSYMLVSAHFRHHRHGVNPQNQNVGGDIDLGYRKGQDSQSVPFLAGDLQKSSTLGINFSYELVWNLYLNGEYNYSRHSEKTTVTSHEFFVSLGLNY